MHHELLRHAQKVESLRIWLEVNAAHRVHRVITKLIFLRNESILVTVAPLVSAKKKKSIVYEPTDDGEGGGVIQQIKTDAVTSDLRDSSSHLRLELLRCGDILWGISASNINSKRTVVRNASYWRTMRSSGERRSATWESTAIMSIKPLSSLTSAVRGVTLWIGKPCQGELGKVLCNKR